VRRAPTWPPRGPAPRSRRQRGSFPEDVQELQSYLEPLHAGQKIQAVPGTGLRVPIWLLGSSLFSANWPPCSACLCLRLPLCAGRPDAGAGALPAQVQALAAARAAARHDGVNVFAADTDEEARRQFTSVQQAFINLRRGTPGPVPAPIDDINDYASGSNSRRSSRRWLIPPSVQPRRWSASFTPSSRSAAGRTHDHGAFPRPRRRLRSFEIASEILGK